MISSTPIGAHAAVALVGAGPGDPELLTRRAVRRLRRADVVVYDALVAPQVLALAPAAKRIFVGKRAGRPAVRQEFINALLVRMARRGKRVVRLKGGDPFVFGRGGEEALALAIAGIPFEIVPGVSAAIAAAALAWVPVTHRGLSSAFVVLSGHAEAAYRAVLDGLAPNSATVVVMMGLAHAGQIAEVLVRRGWNPATPVAILLAAARSPSEVVRVSETEVAACGVDAGGRPGTIVIGQVVTVRSLLRRAGATPPREHSLIAAAPVAGSRLAARAEGKRI
jgi:uroporphyrin-III C-methyltransferase / precorrin-2 dehydrogenase / sirohydrochlorin ferrochelatase